MSTRLSYTIDDTLITEGAWANLHRQDVADQHGGTPYAGFRFWSRLQEQDSKLHRYRIFAHDDVEPGLGRMIYDQYFTCINHAPTGNFERVVGGTCGYAEGWVRDPNTSQPVSVRLQNNSGSGFVTAVSSVANKPRGDMSGNYGFKIDLPPSAKKNFNVTYRVLAQNQPGGNWVELPGRFTRKCY